MMRHVDVRSRFLLRVSVTLVTILFSALVVICAFEPAWWPGLLPALAVQSTAAVIAWRNRLFRLREVLMLALLARVLLAPLTPSLSDDAYRYVWDAWVADEGINPYEVVPEDTSLAGIHDTEVYERLNSKSYYSVYPPLSQLIFRTGTLPVDAGWKASFYLLKSLLMLAEFAALLLLARLVSPHALVLYALNPVVLIEVAGQAHTENVLLFGLGLLVWGIARHRHFMALVGTTVATWVKLYPVLLFPFVFRRTGRRHVFWIFGLSILIVLPFYQAGVLDNIRSSLDLYVRLFEFNAGPYYLTKWLFNTLEIGGIWWWEKTIGPIFRGLFLLYVLVVWLLDMRRRRTVWQLILLIFGGYLFFATTIHPWYLLGILFVAPLFPTPPWPWLWLGVWLSGTYLFYTEGWYWPFVWTGWLGWLVLSIARLEPTTWAARLLRRRAKQKVDFMWPMLARISPPSRILDLGAGEGYVGERLNVSFGARVDLMDVVDRNRTDLPFAVYDGSHTGFESGAFDVVLLSFVLHHSHSAEEVLAEARRISKKYVLVLESVYRYRWEEHLLRRLDLLVNHVRSRGAMDVQAEHLKHRTDEEWRAAFARTGLRVVMCRAGRLPVDRKTAYLLAVPD